MRRKLVNAYLTFERSFGGSRIKDVYERLAPYLIKVVLSARD